MCRATPKTRAAPATLKPSGSRQFSRMLRPGCGGLLIAMLLLLLVIGDQVNVVDLAVGETAHARDDGGQALLAFLNSL